MTTKLLTLFTRTPLHVGAGSSVGAVDQPIIRERHTRFPVIPGSSIKGVLADLFLDESQKPTDAGIGLFGTTEKAGTLLVGEGRLLAFPVRSAKGCFAYLVSPLTLERLARDIDPAGKTHLLVEIANLRSQLGSGADRAVVSEGSHLLFADARHVAFEEYVLDASARITPGIALVDVLAALSSDPAWTQDFAKRLAVVSDELFQYFAENACEIAQHVKIDDQTGTAAPGALFNQENVPSEALFYATVATRESSALDTFSKKLEDVSGLLQLGADATTGLGWCSAALKEVK